MHALRVRSSEGVKNVRDLPADIKWSSFVQAIALATSIPVSHLLIKVGYPPKPLHVADGNVLVFPALVTNGDTITAERSEEALSTPTTSTTPARVPPAQAPAAMDQAKPAAAPAIEVVSRLAPPREAPPLNSDGVVIRRVIADDNSCLFNAVGYVLEGHSRTKAPVLRKLISDIVRADPVTFSDVFLERPNEDYAKWILLPKSWGGQGKGYKQRVFLVYDGLHYDAFGLNPMPDGPEDFDTTVFAPHDDYVCRNALTIVRGLKEKHLYTDTGTFRLLCGDCQAVLVGEKGATEHAMATGHTNFTEAK